VLININLEHRKCYNIIKPIVIIGDVLPEPLFEWYKDKVGKFRFRLKAANGETIAASEGYNSKEGCLNGIESVKKNAPIAKIVETKE
jgi:uncharacterized protein